MGSTGVRPTVDRAAGSLRAWRAEIERDYGALVPPIGEHSPAPALLAAAWRMLRATMVETGFVDRTTKEAVAVAVSQANSCRYLEELHLAVLESLNRRRPVDSDLTALADQRMSRITAWARQPGPSSPFTERHAPELVGTVVVSHYLGRVATVLCTDLPEDTTPDTNRVARRAHHVPHADDDPPPDVAVPLPRAFDWAADRPAVASAFAGADAVFAAAGHRSVPGPVRALVSARVADWHGEPLAPDEDWTTLLPATDRIAGRLAQLTAFDPTSVDAPLLSAYRDQAGTRALVELVGWVSFLVARRIGELVTPTLPMHRTRPAGSTGHRHRPTGPRHRSTHS